MGWTSGLLEIMKTSNGLSLFIVYCGWKLKTMFENKQQHAENMDVKKIVF